MNFGQAVEAIKEGKAVRRAGWNRKGMYVYLNKGSVAASDKAVTQNQGSQFEITSDVDGVSKSLFEIGDFGTNNRLPNLNMATATGSTVTGWLASQTDILAEDWEVSE